MLTVPQTSLCQEHLSKKQKSASLAINTAVQKKLRNVVASMTSKLIKIELNKVLHYVGDAKRKHQRLQKKSTIS